MTASAFFCCDDRRRAALQEVPGAERHRLPRGRRISLPGDLDADRGRRSTRRCRSPARSAALAAQAHRLLRQPADANAKRGADAVDDSHRRRRASGQSEHRGHDSLDDDELGHAPHEQARRRLDLPSVDRRQSATRATRRRASIRSSRPSTSRSAPTARATSTARRPAIARRPNGRRSTSTTSRATTRRSGG